MPEPIKSLSNITGHLTKKQRAAREAAESRIMPSDPGGMRAPGWLGPAERRVFYKTKKRLIQLGLLDSVDVDILAIYSSLAVAVGSTTGKEQREAVRLLLTVATQLGIGAPARARLARRAALYDPEAVDPMQDELNRAYKLLSEGDE